MKPSSFANAEQIAAPANSADVNGAGSVATQDWFSSAELVAMALPGLPADKRSLNRRARMERWDMRCDRQGQPLARKRRGVGGGAEYHVSLLPAEARLELAKRGHDACRPEPREAEAPAVAAWRWFESQTGKVKAEAQRRAAIVADVDLLLSSGMTKTAAVAEAARRHGRGKAVIWGYLRLAEGVSAHDRLPALAPRRKGGGREADLPDALWQIFLSDYLRPERPTLTSCYDRAAAIAAARGETMPSERSIRRKLERDVDARVILLNRGGRDEFQRSIPEVRRTLEGLHAMHIVNVDGHQFDVFVKTPDGKVVRPMMVAIQDVYSSKMLAWRLDLSENFLVTRLAFADLFREYGIPKICLLDNSRTFAGKQLTGGAKTRYRYKVREEEPAGLLTSLGIEIRFATVYHGQAKPIERAFRDISDRVSRGPECAGAYTGNRPTAKPANYGSRAVEWDVFEKVVARGIAAHNARLGRRGRDYRGRSFDQVFADSYAAATNAIGIATPEQLRMALLAAEQKRVNARTGEIELYGNRYWSQECGRLAGQKVTVRFDPDDLMQAVHLYDYEGRYLTSAELIEDTGFLTVEGARMVKKRRKDYLALAKAATAAEELLSPEAIAALQADPAATELPRPGVVRMIKHRTQAREKAASRPAPQPVRNEQESRVFTALGMLRSVD